MITTEETKSDLKFFLQATADMMANNGQKLSLFSFVLEHGRDFKTNTLPKRYRGHRGQIKECFMNAANAAIEDRSLIYCEGYASSIIPVAHAWCVTRKGELVELTWETPGPEYFGIPFRTRYLTESLLRSKYYGLIDQWHNDWPLLRGKYTKKEWHFPLD